MMVLGMNRLRNAYLELDPGVGPYLVTSIHDDQAGLMETYTMGYPRSLVSHVVASTTFFVSAFNSIVAGTLVALVTYVADGGTVLVSVLGAAGGLGHLLVQMALGRHFFGTVPQEPRFPTPTA
jgi:hypothetical protein